jgi:prolyl oligopeptidase
MYDPLAWMEDLNQSVLNWAFERDARCRERLRRTSTALEPEINKYLGVTYLLQLKAYDKGFFCLRRSRGYEVLRDGLSVVSSKELGSDYVIHRFYTDVKGERLAYFYSKGGDSGILRVIDTDSSKTLGEVRGTIGDVLFTSDGFYYVEDFREGKTPDGVAPPASRIIKEGEIVFGKGFESNLIISIKSSSEGSKALITVHRGWTKGEVYCGQAGDPESWTRVFLSEYPVHPIDCVGGSVYLLHHKDFGEILKDGSELMVAKQPMLDATIVDDKILTVHSVHASCYINAYDLGGNQLESFVPSFPSTVSLLTSNGKKALFKLESFGLPYAIYEYDGIFKETEKFEVKRLNIKDGFVSSQDGTKIHFFEVGNKSDKVVVYGYGGFDIAMTPWYSGVFMALLEKGIMLVVANIRGGSEYGEEWHRQGMKENKQKVFDDFAAVLRHFKTKGSKVVAMGRSNGGLLVGATLTQHPELLDAAVIGYPVLDMLRYHLLHVGKLWVAEYGDPDNPAEKESLLRYSPYHNLTEHSYPRTLIYTGLGDDRVHPAHALKFAAKLEEMGAAFCLRVERNSGHVGASFDTQVKEMSDAAAFIIESLKP